LADIHGPGTARTTAKAGFGAGGSIGWLARSVQRVRCRRGLRRMGCEASERAVEDFVGETKIKNVPLTVMEILCTDDTRRGKRSVTLHYSDYTLI